MRLTTFLRESYDLDAIYEDQNEVDELIEHSFDIKTKEIVNELSATADMFPQAWGDINKDDEDTMKIQAIKIYQRAKDMAIGLKKKFIRVLRRISQFKNSKVLVDIKGLDSFIDKAVNRYPKQGKGASNITDVLRSAVLVGSKDEVDQTVSNIKKRFTVAKHKEKKPEGDPKYGYFGSHHFYVKIGNMLAEIQVMTRKLWTYKEQAHKIYNKYRSVDVADKEVEKMDIKLSKRLFQLANTDKKKDRKGKPYLTKRERKYKKFG